MALSASDLVVPDEGGDPLQAQWSRFHDAGPQRVRVRLRRKDGRVLVADFAAVANVLAGVHLSVLHDVTESEAMEAALRDSLDRYHAVAEGLREREAELRETQRLGRIGSWTRCVAECRLRWSEERYEQFGIDPRQAPPQAAAELRALYIADSWQLVKAACERLRDEGRPCTLDLEIVRRDGTHRWITAHGEAVRDAQVRIVSHRGTSIDITESDLAEAGAHRPSRTRRGREGGRRAGQPRDERVPVAQEP